MQPKTHFLLSAGTNEVPLNAKSADFMVESGTHIRGTVPAGATTGKVTVTTPTVTLNSNPQFLVTQ